MAQKKACHFLGLCLKIEEALAEGPKIAKKYSLECEVSASISI